MNFGELPTEKMENFCQSYLLDLNIFSHGTSLSFICFLFRCERCDDFFKAGIAPEWIPKRQEF
jgi:putative component of membrane protein insertase Oxa1/YidC/SpoIIIJ protein YidD